ncbi:MAG: hypothetical protein ACK4NY_16465 [Spirosomataceae bacterium]
MKKKISKNSEIEDLQKQIEKLKSEGRVRIMISILINILDEYFMW